MCVLLYSFDIALILSYRKGNAFTIATDLHTEKPIKISITNTVRITSNILMTTKKTIGAPRIAKTATY